MRGAASVLGVWLVAIAPMCLSAPSTWARGCLSGRMLPWVALVWVAWSGLPIGARGARMEVGARAAWDTVWIALPVLAAACALDIGSGTGSGSAFTMLAVVVAWIWLLGSAASRIAGNERGERIYAWIWFAALPGIFVLERTLAWNRAGGSGGAPGWLTSLAALSPLAWIAEQLGGSRAAWSFGSSDGSPGLSVRTLVASCGVVLALWALSWWLTRGRPSTELSRSSPPLEGTDG